MTEPVDVDARKREILVIVNQRGASSDNKGLGLRETAAEEEEEEESVVMESHCPGQR